MHCNSFAQITLIQIFVSAKKSFGRFGVPIAIVIMVLFGDGVALNDPGSEAGEMTCRVNPVEPPCAFIAIASTLAGLVGNNLIVFCACVGGALEARGGVLAFPKIPPDTWWI